MGDRAPIAVADRTCRRRRSQGYSERFARL